MCDCYIISFIEGEANEKTMDTTMTVCGAEQYITAFQLYDGNILNCLIMDTAGQERFDALNLAYYKKADAVLLVYDISNKNSFDKIKSYYVEKIRDNCNKDIPIVLLGNKTDLDAEKKRQVSIEEGTALALKENYEFHESSCKRNTNVAGAFEALIERWNFENHRKQKNLIRTNSKDKIENNNIINKSFTGKNLYEGMEETINKRTRSFAIANSKERQETINKRARSYTIANGKERLETIQLKGTLKKGKKKKCC